MDIDILLALQQFRNGIGGCLAEFMTKMTFFGELSTTPVLLAIVYWCISKEYGSYLMVGWAGNRLINGCLKVTACAYRPWIRDARIIPYGNSIQTATGYSFPSGHSMNGATVFGGGLVRKDFPLSLRIVLGIIVFLIAFSRIFQRFSLFSIKYARHLMSALIKVEYPSVNVSIRVAEIYNSIIKV